MVDDHAPEVKGMLESISGFDYLLRLSHVFVRDRDARIVYWGPGAYRLYGWTPEEALGRISHKLLKTEFPIPLGEIERTVAEEGSWDGQVIHTTRTRELKTVASYWARHIGPERQLFIVEANNDITELVHLNDRLSIALQRAEES